MTMVDYGSGESRIEDRLKTSENLKKKFLFFINTCKKNVCVVAKNITLDWGGLGAKVDGSEFYSLSMAKWEVVPRPQSEGEKNFYFADT